MDSRPTSPPGARNPGHRNWLPPAYRRLALAVTVAVVLWALLWQVPTGYYITAPGAAHDVTRMVQVRLPDGAAASVPPGAQPGRILMLTVTSQPANLFWYLYGRLDPARTDLETEEEFLGSYPDYHSYDEATRKMMEDSRRFAAAAGLRAASLPVRVDPLGARISVILPDSPGRDVLRNGDMIVELNGQPVATRAALVEVLDRWEPGRPIAAVVRRGAETLQLQIPTTAHPTRGGAAILALVDTEYQFELPVQVDIDPGAVTGPSAGLMFSLEVYRQVTGQDLTGGMTVAGTGTVDPEGNVGPIGGIVQKVYTAEAAGARIMLLPAEHLAEAQTVPTRVQLVGVHTVQEAVDWLLTHALAGSRPQGAVYALPAGGTVKGRGLELGAQ